MTEALYMATVGGGDFWADFGEKVGLFEEGYALDALVLDDDSLKTCAPSPPPSVWSGTPTLAGAH